MMKKKSIVLIIMSLLLALCLTACGGSRSTNDFNAGGFDSTQSVNGLLKSAGSSDAYVAEVDEAQPEFKVDPSQWMSQPTKLIYNGYIDLESVDYDAAESYIRECVEKHGGYFARFDTNSYSDSWSDWGNDLYRSCSATIRVPADNFQDLMNDLKTGGDMAVIRHTVDVEDVSESYYDVKMRLEIAEASVKELEDLLDRADNVQDIIAVRQELADAVYQVESLQGQLNSYDSRVSYSSISLYLTEVTALTMANRVSGYGNKLVESVKKGFYSGIDFLGNLVLWLAANWLTLIIVIAILVGIIRLISWLRRRRIAKKNGTYVPKHKRAANQAAPAQAPEVPANTPAEPPAEHE